MKRQRQERENINLRDGYVRREDFEEVQRRLVEFEEIQIRLG